MRRVFLTSIPVAMIQIGSFVSVGLAEEIHASGKELSAKLDAMDVEHRWQPGRSVAWQTGRLLKEQGPYRPSNTHCSAFVAATCLQMDVYILRPPEHETKDLANAQADWLTSQGKESGWMPVNNPIEAQHLANRGRLVVVAFKEKQPERHGHIAIVRPSEKSKDLTQLEGPQIIQAGSTNANNTTVKEGFKHHAGAFPHGIRYYVNEKVFSDKTK